MDPKACAKRIREAAESGDWEECGNALSDYSDWIDAGGFHADEEDTGSIFDAAQALYWFCADHHEGQGSEKYAFLCASSYNPGASERGPEPDSTAADYYAAFSAWCD